MNFLREQAQARPELASSFEQLEDLFQRKLWHQLSLKIEELIQHPQMQGQPLIEFFLNFVVNFQDRLNQLGIARIAVTVSNQYSDPEQALVFLENQLTMIEGEDARLLVQVQTGLVQMRQEKHPQVKAVLEQSKQKLEVNSGMDPVIHSATYKLAIEFHKSQKNFEEFYKNALMYLAYTPLDRISSDEQTQLASDLAVSALLADNVYNFGELLENSILESLKSTPQQYLLDLLQIFSAGNIEQFASIYTQNKANIDATSLADKQDFLRQKICLMSLMELVFQRPSEQRQITFAEVAQATSLPVDQVELLLMKAMSLKLIRGVIDEIEQKVRVSWVQPRVLTVNQIGLLKEHLGAWSTQVYQTWRNIAPDAITSN